MGKGKTQGVKKRNLKIKKDYKVLRKKRIPQFDAFTDLSDKYHLAWHTVKNILWG